MRKVFLHVLAVAMLAACSEGNGTETTAAPPPVTTPTPTPTPTPYDSSLDTSPEGKDDDQNGIRDDVDAFIEEANLSSEEQSYSFDLAKIYQKILTFDGSESEAVQLSREAFLSYKCLSQESNLGKSSADYLTALSVNTEARVIAYDDFELLAATLIDPIKSDEIVSYCQSIFP